YTVKPQTTLTKQNTISPDIKSTWQIPAPVAFPRFLVAGVPDKPPVNWSVSVSGYDYPIVSGEPWTGVQLACNPDAAFVWRGSSSWAGEGWAPPRGQAAFSVPSRLQPGGTAGRLWDGRAEAYFAEGAECGPFHLATASNFSSPFV